MAIEKFDKDYAFELIRELNSQIDLIPVRENNRNLKTYLINSLDKIAEAFSMVVTNRKSKDKNNDV